MNWRHRVDKAITGKFSLCQAGYFYVGFNEEVKKIIDKCRIKYSRFRDMKHSSGNTFNSSKLYNVNGTTYKVSYSIIPDQCGNLQRQRNESGIKAYKLVQKMKIYNSFDDVPLELDRSIDYRRTDDNGTRVVVWEYIRGIY
jgi:hypothetical protein